MTAARLARRVRCALPRTSSPCAIHPPATRPTADGARERLRDSKLRARNTCHEACKSLRRPPQPVRFFLLAARKRGAAKRKKRRPEGQPTGETLAMPGAEKCAPCAAQPLLFLAPNNANFAATPCKSTPGAENAACVFLAVCP